MNPFGDIPLQPPAPASGRAGEELGAAVRCAPDGCLVAADSGEILDANETAARLLGFRRAELLGAPLAQFSASGTTPALAARLAELPPTGGDFQCIVRRRDGSTAEIEASAARSGAGRTIVFLRDASARKRNDDRFRQLSRAVEQSPALIVITDKAGRIEYVNPRFEEVTGYRSAEVVGQTPRILKSGERSAESYRELWGTVSSGHEWHGEFHNRRKDGSLYWENAAISPIRDEAGRITHYVAIKEDITARKAAEEQAGLSRLQLESANNQLEQSVAHARELAFKAEAANRAKSAFLANMSHELRTPLNVINGLAATLGEHTPESEESRAAQLIVQSGQTLLGTIEKLLDFSGLQAGETQLSLRTFHPVGVLAEALRQAREAIGHRPIRLSYRISPDLPYEAAGDPLRLQLILGNLLTNAIKFTSVGRIHLALNVRPLSGAQFVLEATVYDTGSGITLADQRRLFQPFVRGTGACARHDPGTGLGLTIARAFAQLMGGTITARSRIGSGSAFRCRVVLDRPAQQPPALAQLTPTAWAGRRLLAVSNDAPLLRTLRDFARVWRIELTTAATAAEAVARLSAPGAFDLTLLDADQGTLSELPTAGPVLWLHRTNLPPAPPPGARTLRWPCAPDQLAAEIQNASIAITLPAPVTKAGISARKLGEEIPLRVLVADDMATNREMIRRMLLHLGYAATMAENGIEVLAALERQEFDLLILDVQMPEMDGLEASREIIRRRPDARRRPKIVALTANVLPGSRDACLAAGMDDYLSKPVLPPQLRDCIRRNFPVPPAGAPAPGPTPVAGAVAAVPPAEASATPLVDPTHLAAVLSGLPSDNLQEMLADLHATAVTDYQEQMPRLAAACAARDHAKVHGVVHGLKGCFAMLGWAQLAERCARAQAETKHGTFMAWESFPEDLHRLYEHSEAAMQPYLKNGVPPELLQAAAAEASA